jgi:hypothetical protein
MKIVCCNGREMDIPETYAEALSMLDATMNPYQDRRAGNLERISVAARVAFWIVGERFFAPDPTVALIYLMQEICRRKGAGLDGLEKPRRWRLVDEARNKVDDEV